MALINKEDNVNTMTVKKTGAFPNVSPSFPKASSWIFQRSRYKIQSRISAQGANNATLFRADIGETARQPEFDRTKLLIRICGQLDHHQG